MDEKELVNLINSIDDETSTVISISLSGRTAVVHAADKITLVAQKINIE